jgi:predicted MarR family transcription regulator
MFTKTPNPVLPFRTGYLVWARTIPAECFGPGEVQRRRKRADRLAILAQIVRYQQAHRGRSPSQRHIQTALGLSAASVVHHALHRLAREGLLIIHPTERRQVSELEVTAAGHGAVERWQEERAG